MDKKLQLIVLNTGPMKGLLSNEARVRVSFSSSLNRKLSWTWEQVQITDFNNKKTWVGINTLLSNKLIKAAIEKGFLKKILGDVESIRSEMPYGKDNKSRIDFFLKPKSSNPDNRNMYIEVKNTTWRKKNIALFPDTVTQRGQKHLKELSYIIPEVKSILIPCITRIDVDYFSSGDEADPLYGRLFREAIQKGLIVIPCCFSFHENHIAWHKFIPIL